MVLFNKSSRVSIKKKKQKTQKLLVAQRANEGLLFLGGLLVSQ